MSRERALAEAFVEVADTLVDDFDVIDLLHVLAERCVQLLDVDAAGLMLADQHSTLHASAASSESARLTELFQLQVDAGPCVGCCRSALPVVNVDLEVNAERWPRFAEAARDAGFASVHDCVCARRSSARVTRPGWPRRPASPSRNAMGSWGETTSEPL